MIKFLGAKDIAAALEVTERHVLRLFQSGEIAGFRVGRKPWRTTEAHFESYVAGELQRQREIVRTRGTMRACK